MLKIFSGPSHICCIGLRENYYRRFKVPVMRLYAISFFYLLTMWSRVGEKKQNCVSEAPSAEQASERYSNEARCVCTRCCMDPEVVLCVGQRGVARCKNKIKYDLFLYA